MQVFKFIILILIFISSSYIGLLISKRYSNRTEDLMQIKTALNMLETKIRFTYEPLPEIFEQIGETIPTNIGELFVVACNNMQNNTVKQAWSNSINVVNLNINKEDKNVLNELGNLLRAN